MAGPAVCGLRPGARVRWDGPEVWGGWHHEVERAQALVEDPVDKVGRGLQVLGNGGGVDGRGAVSNQGVDDGVLQGRERERPFHPENREQNN